MGERQSMQASIVVQSGRALECIVSAEERLVRKAGR
jgi:hypothetical protein